MSKRAGRILSFPGAPPEWESLPPGTVVEEGLRVIFRGEVWRVAGPCPALPEDDEIDAALLRREGGPGVWCDVHGPNCPRPGEPGYFAG